MFRTLTLALLAAATPALAQEPTLAAPVEAPAAEAPVVEAPAAEVTSVEVEVEVAPPAVVVESPVVAVPCPTCAPAPVCCPIAILDTRTTLAAKRAYRCGGPAIETVVCVENPADCKLYSVPFCVPGCCLGEPTVCRAHVGLLGRGYADVVWPSGFTATVVFRVHGGAIIIYKG